MNPEMKSLWLSALRSGEYKQGEGMLRTNEDTYCCLGVLTDLYVKAHPEEKWVKDGQNRWGLLEEGRVEIQTSVCPVQVIAWAELPDNNPTVVADFSEDTHSLAEINDGEAQADEDYDHDFNAIADIVEAQL